MFASRIEQSFAFGTRIGGVQSVWPRHQSRDCLICQKRHTAALALGRRVHTVASPLWSLSVVHGRAYKRPGEMSNRWIQGLPREREGRRGRRMERKGEVACVARRNYGPLWSPSPACANETNTARTNRIPRRPRHVIFLPDLTSKKKSANRRVVRAVRVPPNSFRMVPIRRNAILMN